MRRKHAAEACGGSIRRKYAASRLVVCFVSFAQRVISNLQGGIVGRRHSEGAIEERGPGMCAAGNNNLIGVLYVVAVV
jgi:hypothetical protein